MPPFNYIARDRAGARVTGTLEAASRREVLATLASQDLFPLEVDGATSAEGEVRVGRVPPQLMATTLGQLSDLLAAGVPVLRALEVLRKQSSHAALREVLVQVHRRVEDGATLAEAMSRFPRVFGEMAISMVRAGSEGGFLEEALARVATFTETQEDLKGRTLGAVAYPCFLACVGTIVVLVLLVFFVPMFDPIFATMRQRNQLPPLTELLLTTSALSAKIGPWVLAAAAVGGWFLWRWLRTDKGRRARDLVKLRLPVAGKIFRNLAVARFCRVLGTLLHNGVSILRSLDISSDAAGNRILAEAIHKATETISAGKTLAAPLAACGYFPPTVVEMISVAEESNSLEKVLLDIADGLERRTWRQLDLAVRLLEPIMLLLLASVVLVLVIALLLPMFRMATMV
jgi:general secretion pathway protein F/type IV pilus assembly protein PilC